MILAFDLALPSVLNPLLQANSGLEETIKFDCFVQIGQRRFVFQSQQN